MWRTERCNRPMGKHYICRKKESNSRADEKQTQYCINDVKGTQEKGKTAAHTMETAPLLQPLRIITGLLLLPKSY